MHSHAKIALINKPILNLYRVDAITELHTDASLQRYGAILLRRNIDDDALHTIYYASGKTTDLETKGAIRYTLRVLAVLPMAFRYRQQYTAIVLLQIYDVINFDVTSCCDCFSRQGKTLVVRTNDQDGHLH